MKLSITSLTRNSKALSDAIVRGETITLTRHGKDFATVMPIKLSKNPLERQAEKTFYARVKEDIKRSEIGSKRGELDPDNYT